MAKDSPPRWDRRMQQRMARGEAAALGELYDRYAPLVHSLAHRVLDDDEAAGRITREVFGHLWEHPDTYDPKQGSIRSWVANVTQELAVAQLRRTEAAAYEASGETSREKLAALEEKIRRVAAAARADYIVRSMPPPLWDALELAYFQRRDYRQAAADLGVTEDEARRRLRLGLQLLSTANTRAGEDFPRDGTSPPGHGRAR
ncbi:sigma-70 family RNA polymerase sigma factor [Streptomyces sp. NPDC093109]|uniref:RNA polymerase sigma factor n=1 Tax=Streptomyces sp. NPDC093109 TaxID=3154977 RepID=UPI00344D84D0